MAAAVDAGRETGAPFVRPATAASAGPLAAGQVFATRYHVIKMLGAGGMGVVYQAFDTELGVAVAIKVIRPEVLADPSGAADVERRFKRELVLARQVTHKNVVRIHDLGEHEGIKYLTMPFVEGEDLADVLKRRGKLPVAEALVIARQVAHGLVAAHDVGVVHRDLKPENVMLATEGGALIMDFGISRSVSGTSTATAMGAVMGTLEYMAPEQAQGVTVDQRADIYSFGLLLYDMLAGRQRIARRDNPMSEMMSRMQQAPEPLRQLEADVPEPLERIVTTCLQPAVGDRFQTSAELARALDALTPDGHALTAPRPHGRTWLVPAAACIALLAMGVAGWSVWHRASAAVPAVPVKPVSIVIANFDNRAGDPLLDGLVEQALGIGVEGASFVTAYPRREALRVASQIKPGAALTEENARLVATREGIDRVVAGSISAPAPQRYSLEVKILDPADGRALLTWDTEASGKDEVLNAVGRAAAKIRNALGDRSVDPSRMAAAETFTAASLEAAHAYVHAQELQGAGKYEEALAEYKNAVARDPDLGRAYAGMGAVSHSLGRREDAERYYKEAIARIDRMTPRERYRTRGGYYLLVHNSDKAREEFETLVRQFPADSSGLTNLAFAYFLRRDMKRALELGQQASAVYAKNVLRLNNVALYALYAGDYAMAEKTAASVLTLNPQFAGAKLATGLAQLASGRPRDAETTYRALASTSGWGHDFGNFGLADLALYEGRLADAASTARAARVAGLAPGSAARFMVTEAEAAVLQGRVADVGRLVEDALRLSKDAGLTYLAGRILVATGKSARAQELAADLGRQIDTEPQLYARLLTGEIALKAEDARAALAAFQGAQQFSETWLEHFGLGRAYVLAGKFPEASSEFDWCRQHSGEATALLLDDIPTLRFVPQLQYYVARTEEGLKSAAAKTTFAAFLAVKEKGDEQDLVADARRRLEKLSSVSTGR